VHAIAIIAECAFAIGILMMKIKKFLGEKGGVTMIFMREISTKPKISIYKNLAKTKKRLEHE